MNKVVFEKDRKGYSFEKARERAKRRTPYYEEKLLLDASSTILREMDARGITRKKLSERLHVSPAYVTKVLRGNANLTLESLARIGAALGMKWKPLLINKNLRLGPYALIPEQTSSIEKVERVTLPTLQQTEEEWDPTQFEHGKETRYDIRIPA